MATVLSQPPVRYIRDIVTARKDFDQSTVLPVASFTKEVNSRLVNRGFTSLVKETTGVGLYNKRS